MIKFIVPVDGSEEFFTQNFYLYMEKYFEQFGSLKEFLFKVCMFAHFFDLPVCDNRLSASTISQAFITKNPILKKYKINNVKDLYNFFPKMNIYLEDEVFLNIVYPKYITNRMIYLLLCWEEYITNGGEY